MTILTHYDFNELTHAADEKTVLAKLTIYLLQFQFLVFNDYTHIQNYQNHLFYIPTEIEKCIELHQNITYKKQLQIQKPKFINPEIF